MYSKGIGHHVFWLKRAGKALAYFSSESEVDDIVEKCNKSDEIKVVCRESNNRPPQLDEISNFVSTDDVLNDLGYLLISDDPRLNEEACESLRSKFKEYMKG